MLQKCFLRCGKKHILVVLIVLGCLFMTSSLQAFVLMPAETKKGVATGAAIGIATTVVLEGVAGAMVLNEVEDKIENVATEAALGMAVHHHRQGDGNEESVLGK